MGMKMEKIDELIDEIRKLQKEAKTRKGEEALSLILCSLQQLKAQKLALYEKMLVIFEIGVGFKMWDVYEKPSIKSWFKLREKIIDVFIEIAK
jgi:hypothetical protein